ncbi:MAG TPA: site-specific integrase [Planctomycetota bacterium]|nr:site-specific integrase [Planctomycetota bacterium]
MIFLPTPSPDDGSPLLWDLVHEFQRTRIDRVSNETVRKARQHFARLIAAGFARLSDVTPPRVARYLERRAAEGLSSSTLNHELAVIVKLVRWLHRREEHPPQRSKLRELMLELRTLRLPGDSPGTIVFFSRDEFVRLRVIAGEIAPWFRLAFEVACFTGLRRSELRVLDREDFDLEAKLLRVRRKTDRLGDAGDTKTRRERNVPLASELLEIVRERAPKSGAMFPALSRLALTPYVSDDTFRWAMQELGRRSGIVCRWHKCRKTFTTWSVSAGLSIFDVSSFLGHTEPGMTARHYAAFVPRWKPEIDRLNTQTPTKDPATERRELAERLLVQAKTATEPAPLLAAARALLRGTLGERVVEGDTEVGFVCGRCGHSVTPGRTCSSCGASP